MAQFTVTLSHGGSITLTSARVQQVQGMRQLLRDSNETDRLRIMSALEQLGAPMGQICDDLWEEDIRPSPYSIGYVMSMIKSTGFVMDVVHRDYFELPPGQIELTVSMLPGEFTTENERVISEMLDNQLQVGVEAVGSHGTIPGRNFNMISAVGELLRVEQEVSELLESIEYEEPDKFIPPDNDLYLEI